LRLVPLISALLTSVLFPTHAYALSQAKGAVIIKTDNGTAQPLTCKVDRTFKAPERLFTVSCTQKIPASAKSWYVCVRPTGGKALEFAEGNESCK
jgi:hypothetical protein